MTTVQKKREKLHSTLIQKHEAAAASTKNIADLRNHFLAAEAHRDALNHIDSQHYQSYAYHARKSTYEANKNSDVQVKHMYESTNSSLKNVISEMVERILTE